MKSELRNKWIVALAMLPAVVLAAGVWEAAAEPAAPATTVASKSSTKSVRVDPPLSDQFADASTDAVPDFQKHVMPLIGRLGCNGRACHGSFQGRGGFALSLFGYDFSADHQALLADESGRVDVDDPAESLVLYKPTDADAHEGGKLFDEDDWRYNVLKRWIESGAKFETKQVQTIEALEVTPAEIVFADEGEQQQLKVVAKWPDGSEQDVTELSRFKTNDDSIASIDEDGLVRSAMTGDTHLVVFYDNAVVSVPVLRPIGRTKSAVASVPRSNHFIDVLVREKLDKLNVEPSPVCDDADFIRRVTLDISGLLPQPERVRQFLADKSPDKREQLIDELLASPGYSAWWATRMSDWTGNSEQQLRNLLPARKVANQLWYSWLRERIAENTPYDEMIAGIVTARSREPGENYEQYCENMSECCKPGGDEKFAKRENMPLYWGRQNLKKKEESAIGFAYTFLGLRIECAQCHKHPFDTWSKDDFDQFANLFTPIQFARNSVDPASKSERDAMMKRLFGDTKLRGNQLQKQAAVVVRDGGVVPFGELIVRTRSAPPRKAAKNKKNKVAQNKMQRRVPRGLILGEEDSIALDRDPRDDLMDWMRDADNPYFAKAIVNRVWANYFGIGLVNPTDDLNLANPPSNGPLLETLASQFIENGFDLHWLHRTITTSDTYARSSTPNASNEQDRKNFSHHIPHRLPAEVLHDAVTIATASNQRAKKLQSSLDKLAIANAKAPDRNRQDFAMQVFGQSIRESNCDCDRSDSPNLLQAVFLRNDNEMHAAISDSDGWVHQVCTELGVSPPKSNNSKKTREAAQIKALQKRLVSIAKVYHASEKAGKQSRAKGQLKTFKSIKRRLVALGQEIPSPRMLATDPDAWQKVNKQKTTKQVASSNRQEDARGHGSLVEDAYLRILSRFPSDEEKSISLQHINESDEPSEGYSTLVWALVNTKEFSLTH